MDAMSFDQLTRQLLGERTRRAIFGRLAALSLAGPLGLWVAHDDADAKKKRKRKRKDKHAKPNEFGCLEIGDPCQSEEQCCSGICAGKKGQRKCRAHDTGTCVQGMPGLCTAANPETTRCNNADCSCYRTTAGSNVCSSDDTHDFEVCVDCQRDADCQELGFPPGSSCTVVSQGRCAGECESGTACLLPCGFVPPGPA
jgi:hypothetical protein